MSKIFICLLEKIAESKYNDLFTSGFSNVKSPYLKNTKW
jgi:hypothetical protein